MYRKFIHTTHKRFLHVSSTIPISFLKNKEEILATKLAPILKSCSENPTHCDFKQGQQVHTQIVVNGIKGLLCTRILGMYVLSGKYFDAKRLFFELDLSYASPWNWIIRGFTMMGCFDFALLVFFKMLSFGTLPDKYSFPYVIKACGGLNAVKLGRLVHDMVRLRGFELDAYVSSSLIKLYAENGCILDARCLFDKLPVKDSVLWNVMLNGYVRCRDSGNVVGLFRDMRFSDVRPNSVTFACVLSVCASEMMIELGTQIHGVVVKCGLEMESRVANTLIALYSKSCFLSDARELFDTIPEIDLVSWNGMIGGYVSNGYMLEALDLFRKMVSACVKPDSISFASFLPLVSETASLNQGKEIHCYIVRQGVVIDVFLKNALIDMYFKCRQVMMAKRVFSYNSAVDIVIYSAMISGYVLNEMNVDAIAVFRSLIHEKMKPNVVTLSSLLPACAGLAALHLGKELHGNILKHGQEGSCHVGSAITDMYAKCGRLDLARQFFLRMSERDAVCWNSIITSCSQNGNPVEAIDLFRRMSTEDVDYDGISISAALSACSSLSALHYGKEIHGFMIRGVFSLDIFAESALIDMYAKCGNLELARRVFDMMQEKNEVSWSSIIAAYGSHGHLKEALALFHEMKELGFQPDHVTFLAIISACGHAGRVEEGKHYFKCMEEDHKITARMEHYACMIDLFARAGRLEEAYEFIKCMPFEPDAGVWGTLLGSCRVHGNVDLAELAAGNLFNLDPQNSGYYVLLANTQADAGKWERVLKTRSIMKERGVQKIPGYSWIEVNNYNHMFVAADTSHSYAAEVYFVLDHLLLELRKEGYVPQPYLPLHMESSKLTSLHTDT